MHLCVHIHPTCSCTCTSLTLLVMVNGRAALAPQYTPPNVKLSCRNTRRERIEEVKLGLEGEKGGRKGGREGGRERGREGGREGGR